MTWQTAIAEHAKRAAPQEACGVLLSTETDLEAVPLRNAHADPVRYFRLDPTTYPQLLAGGKVRAYYHSHPTGPAEFSTGDKAYIEETGLPCYLYDVPTGQLLGLAPSGWMPPLEGRAYMPGIADCFALVRDWHRQETGLELQFPPRTLEMNRSGIPDAGAIIGANRLVRVTGEPQRGDILAMNIHSRNGRPNHLAVYVGAGLMLHQLVEKPSESVPYGSAWKKLTTLQLRHESLLPAPAPAPVGMPELRPGENMSPPAQKTDPTLC